MATLAEAELVVHQARIEALPRLKAFCDEVSAIHAAGGSFLDDCEAPFAALVRDRAFVPDLVHYELTKLERAPTHTIPRANENSFPVASGDYGRLTLRLVAPPRSPAPPPERLVGIPNDSLLGVFGPGRIATERFEETPGGPMRRVGVEETGPGGVRKYVAGRDLIHSTAISGPTVWLTFVAAKGRPTYWMYDYKTCARIRQHGATSDTPRLEYAARLLCELGHKSAAPAIAALCEHPDHYIRWGALRQLARLDPDRALRLLQTAKDDPHPHVRNAAKAALARFHGEAG